MSQLTLLLLVALAGWIAWRMYGPPARLAQRSSRARRRRPAARSAEITTLEKDPKTGVYHPIDRDRPR